MYIVVVDDTPIKRKSIIRGLLDYDRTIEIKECSTGMEAVEIIKERIPDWLVSDMHYSWQPGENDYQCGIRVIETLNDMGIHVKTIFCSSGRVNADKYDDVKGVVTYTGQDLEDAFAQIMRRRY